MLRKLGLWSCLVFMAASWLLEKEKEEGGHQAVVFGLLVGLLLIATWAIEALVPFQGWWQALRLTLAVIDCGLAYPFLTKGSGSDFCQPSVEERHDVRAGSSLSRWFVGEKARFRPVAVIKNHFGVYPLLV